jgi:hypothetical protein
MEHEKRFCIKGEKFGEQDLIFQDEVKYVDSDVGDEVMK